MMVKRIQCLYCRGTFLYLKDLRKHTEAEHGTPPEAEIDPQLMKLVSKIFQHGRDCVLNESPYSHTPGKFYEEAQTLLNSALIKELEACRAAVIAATDGVNHASFVGKTLAETIFDGRIRRLRGKDV